ncbi:MAG TPA: HAMP domain-containing sensor histidine kinase [Candidatus Binatia bacterium]|nr:HAMP domain-containing sensor histidine kinase [Candidatus Binatia bacterium]
MTSGEDFRHLGGGHKGLFLTLRYVFIIAASYLLIFQSTKGIGPMQALMIAAALGSNVVLSIVSPQSLFAWYVEAPILITDTLWVSWALSSTGSVGGEFFLLYFFVLFLSSTGESIVMVALGTTLVSAANVYFMWGDAMWSSRALLRIVFFFTVALFYGHVISRIKHERLRADRGLAWAKELEAKVAERTAELRRLYEESLAASRAKSEFVANMSHELRTPLHIIIGYADVLADPEHGGDVERRRMVARIRSAASGLLHLVDNVLDLGRLESGAVQVVPQRVPMEELARALLEREWLPAAPGVALSWEVPPGLPVVETDADKLGLVLGNLITNALKFTRAGSVTVRVFDRREREHVEFRIDDTGPGIAEADLARIFEPFQQLPGGNGRGHGGVGLGLAIVQRYAALLGATVSVESQVGRGTSFVVCVPYRLEAPLAARPASRAA